ncbi:MAG: CDP-alcohol phosphatidyltransferase family protein [Enterococcus sp.]|nr:CDP-alcohol phosphatidyltransferase family protein [Enterococcus sp.]
MDNSNENKIFTVPNLISFIRLLCIPVFVIVLFYGNDIVACFLYSLIALTDFVDGLVARKTNSVSRLGKILDPAVDSLLMIAAIVSLFILGRLPLWIFLFIVIRYAVLLIGGGVLLKIFNVRVDVLYIGKIGSAFLCLGVAWLILNMPVICGLGIVPYKIFPGFCKCLYCPGIWPVYIGCAIALFTTIYYIVKGVSLAAKAKK